MAEEALSVIAELRGQGITIMLVEQNVQNALSVADPAYVFDTGRVVAHDTSPRPPRQPRSPQGISGRVI
jgi:branched-chain amino acid transport system ATP-binding protein